MKDQISLTEEGSDEHVLEDVEFMLVFSAANLTTLGNSGLLGLSPSSPRENQKTLLSEFQS